MAELATIARPYAEALFKAAGSADKSALVGQVQALAAVAADAQMRQFADSPKVSAEQVFEVLTSVAKVTLTDAQWRAKLTPEQYDILRGHGTARAGDVTRAIGPGDCFMLPPGTEHVVANPGPGKLYCLTIMVPDEAFAALIRAGTPAELDAEDLAVLRGE